MTNAELIKALRYCAEHEGCDYYIAKDCPREDTWVCGADCEQILMIDAAAALKAADKRIAELEAQMQKEGEWIDEQRGRWIYAKCNLCGKVQDVRSNYCPNCGAKMNGERKDGEHDNQRM
ncbi:MAG: hypothetical protein IIX13_09675 [Bacteroidales bacterium]|nr:hypothetical protein [Bacteroidales bacterium]